MLGKSGQDQKAKGENKLASSGSGIFMPQSVYAEDSDVSELL